MKKGCIKNGARIQNAKKITHFVSEARNLRQCDRSEQVTCHVHYPLGIDNAKLITLINKTSIINNLQANLFTEENRILCVVRLGSFSSYKVSLHSEESCNQASAALLANKHKRIL